MSGGKFEYRQYEIDHIADQIQHELDLQGKERVGLCVPIWYYDDHPEEVQREMRNAIKALRVAAVYAQRVDWYLSGDDGVESFLERLKEELENIEKLKKENHES